MYPDAYEVGLPNQGVQILYEVINERDDALAERTYSVWPDLEALMREHGIGQFTVDAHRPVAAFDLLGVSFSTELGYTNLLTALDLAGIPLHARDRDETHPIVVAGGHAAFNPEPIADFVDAAVLGDGEQAVGAITDIVRDAKRDGASRDELLLRLARTGGVYVPRFYDVTYLPDGRIAAITPNRQGVPERISKHTVMDLDEWPYPKTPLVPLAESVHERMSVEIFPGLHEGLPVLPGGHDHPPGTRAVDHRHRRDGREWPCRNRIRGGRPAVPCPVPTTPRSARSRKGLADRYEGEQVSLSLPSTRVDAFNIDLANELSRNGRRSGLTFAPEGGSERLRRVINKMVSKDDLIRTVTTAYTHRSGKPRRSVVRPRLPQHVRLPQEFRGFVRTHGEQERCRRRRPRGGRRHAPRFGNIEPEVDIVGKVHHRREVVNARKRDAADERRSGESLRTPVGRVHHRRQMAAGGMAADDDRRRCPVRRALLGKPAQRAPALRDRVGDRARGTEFVVDHRHGESRGDERRRDECVVGFVETAPPAAVNVHQRPARGPCRQVEVERLRCRRAVAHVARRDAATPSRLASARATGRSTAGDRGPPRGCCSPARPARVSALRRRP